jgi:hypothetical protein
MGHTGHDAKNDIRPDRRQNRSEDSVDEYFDLDDMEAEEAQNSSGSEESPIAEDVAEEADTADAEVTGAASAAASGTNAGEQTPENSVPDGMKERTDTTASADDAGNAAHSGTESTAVAAAGISAVPARSKKQQKKKKNTNRADGDTLQEIRKRHKKKRMIAVIALITAAAVAAGGVFYYVRIWLPGRNQSATASGQQGNTGTKMQDMDVITASGTTSIGIVEDTFDLDLADTELDIETVYASSQDEVKKGDPILKLTDDSVSKSKTALEQAAESAEYAYDLEVTDSQASTITAGETYNKAVIAQKYAQQDYDDTVAAAQAKIDDLNSQISDQQDLVDEYTAASADSQYYYKKYDVAAIEKQLNTDFDLEQSLYGDSSNGIAERLEAENSPAKTTTMATNNTTPPTSNSGTGSSLTTAATTVTNEITSWDASTSTNAAQIVSDYDSLSDDDKNSLSSSTYIKYLMYAQQPSKPHKHCISGL